MYSGGTRFTRPTLLPQRDSRLLGRKRSRVVDQIDQAAIRRKDEADHENDVQLP